MTIGRRERDKLGDHEVAELAALADGSLAPDRRAALEARIAASPELAELLAEQERAVVIAHGAFGHLEAPSGLRARVESQQDAGRRWAPGRLVAIGAPAAALAAAAVVAVVIIASGTSAERFHTALGATELAPGASGKATLTKTTSGWRVELDATGLPRLADGRFYEAWLKNPAGVLVPIGTFNEGRHVTLWSGVSPLKGFTTLTVTQERTDGDQASSGRKVLVGTVDTHG